MFIVIVPSNMISKTKKIWTSFIPLVKYSSTNGHSTFNGVKDIFNGITVDSSKETCSHTSFPSKLEESLKKWTQNGNRCIWFKINIQDASFVPALAQKGFNFHHARDDFVMMYKWLPQDTSPNLPPASHTNLGVGAMVLNEKQQILAISEKNYGYKHWKLPGGYVERGEDIIDAAVREVREETGIVAEFVSLITFRHTHKMMYGNSDIYVLLMLKALTEDITIGQREVRDCKWMEIEEYVNSPHVHEFNRKVINMALDYRKRNMKLDIEKKTVKWAQFTREMNFLFITNYN